MNLFARRGLMLIGVLGLSACRPDSAPEQTTTSAVNTNTPVIYKHTNRLATEKSPYLLQHAHNPVDWYPWGEEAFAKARAENKPIFLSIGYSTCHWCHVMERESFEDEKIAAFLNEHFVSIKVDREERPDVDKIYMTFVQATTGAGGWPLNVFLTPDLKPFFGGTYFPPDDRYGRGSFLSRAPANRQRLEGTRRAKSPRPPTKSRRASNSPRAPPTTVQPARSRRKRCVARGLMFKEAYDPQNGGFGGAPKFPQPSHAAFLLRYAKRFSDDGSRRRWCCTPAIAWRPAAFTINSAAASRATPWMPNGSCRTSRKCSTTTRNWRSFISTPIWSAAKPRYAEVVRDILDYVLRDMTHPDGGFYSAEDADSEGQEGKFYCWTHDELSKLLTPEEFNVAARYFGITKEGNFVDHSHPHPLPGQNVLSVVDPKVLPMPTSRCSHPPKPRCSPCAPNASARIWTTKFSLPGTA